MKEAKEYIGITKLMKDGYYCTIIDNNGKTRVTVQYEDGTIKTHRSLKNFLNGVLKKYNTKQNIIGQKRKMNCGMECTIIAYRNFKDIDVQFEDGNIIKNRNYSCFLKGKILNDRLPHNWCNIDDLTGKKFNRWTVIKYDKNKINNPMVFWICQCECGTIKSVASRDLKKGYSKSCGCLKKELMTNRMKNNTRTDKIKNIYPELIKYLVNKEDGELTLGQRNKQIECICPLCKTHRTYSDIRNFYTYGFTCVNCSPKISYPNRFIYKFLNQLNIEFETEKVFSWSKNKRYDFYIPKYSCIIEAQGGQHYKDTHWSTLEYQQNNDKNKENLAILNGIKNYIQLDCKRSDFEYIKNSILNNKILDKLFNLSKIDWKLINKELKEV